MATSSWGLGLSRSNTPLPAPPPHGGREPIAARPQRKSIGFSWRAGAAERAALAGLAWGVPMAVLFVALDVWRCGVLCLTDAAFTLAIATIGGISTIGVFAAWFGGTAPGSVSRRNLSRESKSWLASSS
jgi:hypothetical protein